MRHRVAGRKLSRTSEHRLALRRNLVASLIEHETISTTIGKAKEVKAFVKKILGYGLDLSYQQFRQKQVYKRVKAVIDLQDDHRVSHLEGILKDEDLYSFDVGTEACLSIPGIIEYVREGFNGVVNVYPFTCMPSTITSSIVKPIMNRMKVPYLDTPYDGTYQPGREAAIRTFMYQAKQHFKRNGRKNSDGH